MAQRCRHRKTWLIAAGTVEWCYACGAFRRCQHTRPTAVVPTTPWCKPTGPDGENPFAAWMKRAATYRVETPERLIDHA